MFFGLIVDVNVYFAVAAMHGFAVNISTATLNDLNVSAPYSVTRYYVTVYVSAAYTVARADTSANDAAVNTVTRADTTTYVSAVYAVACLDTTAYVSAYKVISRINTARNITFDMRITHNANVNSLLLCILGIKSKTDNGILIIGVLGEHKSALELQNAKHSVIGKCVEISPSPEPLAIIMISTAN